MTYKKRLQLCCRAPDEMLRVPGPKFWMSWRITEKHFQEGIPGKVEFRKKWGDNNLLASLRQGACAVTKDSLVVLHFCTQ